MSITCPPILFAANVAGAFPLRIDTIADLASNGK
jgi:hypothetical protein